MTAVLIFLIAFVILGGVVMFLSRTIDAGEARFDTRERDEDPPPGDDD